MTAAQRLADALPADPALDGPIGVNSADLRTVLSQHKTAHFFAVAFFASEREALTGDQNGE